MLLRFEQQNREVVFRVCLLWEQRGKLPKYGDRHLRLFRLLETISIYFQRAGMIRDQLCTLKKVANRSLAISESPQKVCEHFVRRLILGFQFQYLPEQRDCALILCLKKNLRFPFQSRRV